MRTGWDLDTIKKMSIPYFLELNYYFKKENEPKEEKEINDVSELAKFAKKLK